MKVLSLIEQELISQEIGGSDAIDGFIVTTPIPDARWPSEVGSSGCAQAAIHYIKAGGCFEAQRNYKGQDAQVVSTDSCLLRVGS